MTGQDTNTRRDRYYEIHYCSDGYYVAYISNRRVTSCMRRATDGELGN